MFEDGPFRHRPKNAIAWLQGRSCLKVRPVSRPDIFGAKVEVLEVPPLDPRSVTGLIGKPGKEVLHRAHYTVDCRLCQSRTSAGDDGLLTSPLYIGYLLMSSDLLG